MDRFYLFLIRNDVWIYIVCALGLLWYLTELARGQSALRRAMFRLERETALRKRNAALFFSVLLTAIILVVAYVNVIVRPTLPSTLLQPPTPTPDRSALPATSVPETTSPEMVTPTSPVAATVTLQANEVPTTTRPVSSPTAQPAATQPVTTIAGCEPDANISDPGDEASIPGLLNVFGTANTSDFGYYELEISGPQTNGRWASLLGRRITQPVDDGILGGNLDLAAWTPGPYRLRLTVADNSGMISNQCLVSIVLDR